MAPVYEKYEPIAGGFRATLAAAVTVDANGNSGIKACSLDANGRAVVGTAGQSGLVGVFIKNVPVTPGSIVAPTQVVQSYIWQGVRAGDVIDVMTHGQIIDADPAVFVAGSKVYAHADGTVDVTATAGTIVGFTLAAGHIVINVSV